MPPILQEDGPISLTTEQKNDLLRRYGHPLGATDLAYGTVEDYCDSSDHVSFLTGLQGDLKDLQRPAAFKTVLGLAAPGTNVLEVGAGEPHVAHTLSQLGYQVTVVDPYDGSGNGPVEFERYARLYPHLQIVRALFSDELATIEQNSFDCIYSISVLEHVHQPGLSSVFRGIARFLKPGGYSLHLIDHVWRVRETHSLAATRRDPDASGLFGRRTSRLRSIRAREGYQELNRRYRNVLPISGRPQ